MMPPISFLRKILTYNPKNGVFVWNIRDDVPAWWNAKYSGHVAGSRDAYGYWIIRINGRTYKAHRIAMVYMAERPIPDDLEIDHKDGNRTDNSFSNLRLANDQQNAANAGLRCDNGSGIKGVCWHRRQQKWQAQINQSGKRKSLGYFDSKEAARRAYESRASELHGEFARL